MIFKYESQIKSISKSFQACKHKLAQMDQKYKSLLERNKNLEAEKVKLSEKWIKLSAKNK